MSIPKPLANIGREFSKVLMSFYLYCQCITSLSSPPWQKYWRCSTQLCKKIWSMPYKMYSWTSFFRVLTLPQRLSYCHFMSFNLSGVTAQLFFPWTWLPSFCSESSGEIGKAMRFCRTFKWRHSPQCALSRPLSLSTSLLHFLLSLLSLSFLHPSGQASCQQCLINS